MDQITPRIARTTISRTQVVALSLLTLVSLFNYLDRHMFGVLLPAIKAELHLTDTELGFITGTAFTLFYATMGIPIGRLADRVSRRAVIAGTLAIWSSMTAACGLAQTFLQLALARIVMGTAGAGATPPAMSLISDLFSRKNRAKAISVYAMGLPVGIFVGYMAGGLITQNLGWRIALLVCGLPGLVLAIAIAIALPEPARGASERATPAPSVPIPLRQVIKTLAARRTFLHVTLGSGLYTMVWAGLLAWLPSYFLRTFNLPLGIVAAKLGLVLAFSQLLGLGLGGVIGDRLAQRDSRWYLWIGSAASLMPLPFYAIVLLTSQADVAFIALFPAFMLGTLQGTPIIATIQGLAAPPMRATASAIYFVTINLISGAGSQLIGYFSDSLTPQLGASALAISILGVALVSGAWSSWHFWRGARTIRADFASTLAE